MTSKRVTIHINERTGDQIGTCDSLSGRIASIVERYCRMIKDVMPTLTKEEWCAICDANNGTDVFGPDNVSSTMIWANVHDSVGLGDKWGIDQDALVRRLQGMSASELLAISEVCVRFWQDTSRPAEEALQASGARIGGADA